MKFLSLIGLAEHRQTGRLLPHHHTSYLTLLLIAVFGGAVLLGATQKALADPPPIDQTLFVNASVAGNPPATAPTIDVPTNGQQFSAIPITVSGTCQAGLLVKVFSNNVFVGSATCVGGSFTLQVDLFFGSNDLVARQYNILDESSPPSNTVTVSYNPPATPGGTTGKTGGKTGKKGGVSIPKANQLIITSKKAYQGVLQGQTLSWPLTISGGKTPYAISVDWGDGHTDLISRPAEGDFVVTHSYSQNGRFTITIKAADQDGQQAFLQLVSLVSGKGAAVTKLEFPSSLLLIWPLYLLILLILSAYWLGEHHEQKVMEKEVEVTA
jgi:hypothetical protein